MASSYNNIEHSECGSEIFTDSGDFRTERFPLQLNGTWESDFPFASGKSDVFFNDGVSKIDIILAFEDGHENSRSRDKANDRPLPLSISKRCAY